MRFRDFFLLHRSDRQALLFLLCVAVAILFALHFAGDEVTDTASLADTKPMADEQPMVAGNADASSYDVQPVVHSPERFPFDPNTADSTQLLRLGLQPWQVRNIYKYRARGGIYRQKEDFARLYGLTVKQYRELEPYIHISNDYLPASTLVGDRTKKQDRTKEDNKTYERDTVRFPIKIKEGEHIVLNHADTAQLKKVPGIGSYYAREILRYGKWLGGYVHIDQLDEIEGFPQEAKKYFVIQSASPKKLNVNLLSLAELRRHPYINYYQAKAITDYRRLHGPLKSLDDLSLSSDFPPQAIERLKPYVEF